MSDYNRMSTSQIDLSELAIEINALRIIVISLAAVVAKGTDNIGEANNVIIELKNVSQEAANKTPYHDDPGSEIRELVLEKINHLLSTISFSRKS